ncbi:MAG: YraN family protein [Bryobacteraceae bacterium]
MAPLYRFADHLRYRRHGNVGRRGEDLAHRYLRKKGYIVVARNWRPPQGGGEIDLIAWEREALVFVEVKTRLSAEWSAPERDIDQEKIFALRRAARDYIRRAEADASTARFDVLSIVGEKVEHLREAFPMMLPL